MSEAEMTGAGGRQPGFAQGLVVISLAWVSTVAAVLLGPVLPTIAQVFKAVPAVDLKIPLVATGPSLLVAALAVPFGFLADRIGRRLLLLGALCLYGAAGMAPLLLSNLDTIVVTRLVVGLAEAAIMTCGTALIGDYFRGRSREKWLAAQAGFAPLSAVGLVILGGALGAFGWRTPFYVYGWGFILVPLVLVFLWEPRRGKHVVESAAEQAAAASFSWAKSLMIATVVVLSMIAFMVTVVQFGFLMTERGVAAPQVIGLWSALVTFANPIGSLVFSVTKGRIASKLAVSYALLAIGFAVMALVPTAQAAIIGGFIANLGAGAMLPAILTWLLSTMPPTLIGRGSGLWTSANFMGQFLGPLAIVGLTKATGNLSHAILSVGVGCAAGAIIAGYAMIRGPRPAA